MVYRNRVYLSTVNQWVSFLDKEVLEHDITKDPFDASLADI